MRPAAVFAVWRDGAPLDGELETDVPDYAADPDGAKKVVNDQLEALTGKGMDAAVLDEAWGKVVFTADPLASTLAEGAAHASAVGLLEQPDLTGLYAVDTLNGLLAERKEKAVSVP